MKNINYNDDGEINAYKIKAALTAALFGKELIYLEETDSTNEEAKRQAKKGADEGFLVIAKKQTRGKGRHGNVWNCSNGSNLAFSLVLKPDKIFEDITSLTLTAGLSVCSALRKAGVRAFVKWPNDIIINGKKAVGILVETSFEDNHIAYIIAGIGINVNERSFDGELKEKATSLYIETGRKFDKIQILNLVLTELEKNYYKFIKEGNFSIFSEEYKSLCLNIGKEVKAISRESVITGIAEDISKKGELIINTGEKGRFCAVSGEVSIRLMDGKYI